jgi:hypothetical protein
MDNWFWCFWTCSEREINYLVPEILALVGLVLIPRVQVNKVQFDIIYTLPKLVGHLLWSENLALTESDIRSMQLISVGRVQRTPSFYFTTRSSNCPSQWKHLSDTTDCLNPHTVNEYFGIDACSIHVVGLSQQWDTLESKGSLQRIVT